jgi:hypothetical protein
MLVHLPSVDQDVSIKVKSNKMVEKPRRRLHKEPSFWQGGDYTGIRRFWHGGDYTGIR